MNLTDFSGLQALSPSPLAFFIFLTVVVVVAFIAVGCAWALTLTCRLIWRGCRRFMKPDPFADEGWF